MDPDRKTALAVGILFLATFVTSIPAVFLYHPLLDDPSYLLNGGSDTGVTVGAVLELLLIVANIGTAVVLYPVLKRQSASGALGYVTARIMECAFIAVGILALLAAVTLSEDSTASPATLGAISEALVAVHDWTFRLGPGFVVGLGNGILLGYLMYRSGLVPPRMAILGLVGGPLIVLTGVAVVLGIIDEESAPKAIATAPEFAWELSLGVYLTVKGFRRAPSLLGGGPESAVV
ncbi:MAG TPA: DUF4386 domain-containing protein [Solirubrobacterales bacterium]|nr:DUF4386 domain-containing protein [Solirubrobacterales bacterium]